MRCSKQKKSVSNILRLVFNYPWSVVEISYHQKYSNCNPEMNNDKKIFNFQFRITNKSQFWENGLMLVAVLKCSLSILLHFLNNSCKSTEEALECLMTILCSLTLHFESELFDIPSEQTLARIPESSSSNQATLKYQQ